MMTTYTKIFFDAEISKSKLNNIKRKARVPVVPVVAGIDTIKSVNVLFPTDTKKSSKYLQS